MFLLGLLGLAGGLSGRLGLSEILASSIPMALSTAAWIMAAACLLALLPALAGRPAWARALALALAALLTAVGLVNVLEYFLGLDPFFDPLDRAAYDLQESLLVPPTPMSPLAGAVLAVAGFALVLLVPRRGEGPVKGGSLPGILGGVVCVAALTLILGYVYRVPLLYGSGVVPVAFPTSLALLLTGLGIVCAAGPASLPLRPFAGQSTQARILRAFSPVMGLVALVFPILSKLLLMAGINDALTTSLWAIAFAGAVLLLVIHIGRTIGTSLDTAETMRDQAVESLRLSEDRFRSTFEQAAVGIAHKDMEGNWLLVNQKFCDIVGYTREEMLTRTFQEITYPEDLEKDLDNLLELTKGDVPMYSMEKRYIRKNGDLVWVDLTVSMVRGQTGDPGYYISVIQDITARKRVERELDKARSYIKNIINSMPSVVIGVDALGRVTHFNTTASRLLTKSEDCAVGTALEKAFPEYASQLERISQAIARREPVLLERQPQTADGDLRYQDILIYPLVANGVEGAVLRIDDVTERVRLTEMMVQTEKMMSVGGLAAGMAHEINNPLGAILQSAQVIQMHLDPSSPINARVAEECGCSLGHVVDYLEKRKVLTFLQSIREAGIRAAKIVANMLEFSRSSDSGKEPTSLEEVLDKGVELASSDYDLKKKFDFRHIAIAREYAQDLPRALCSRTEIEQVVLNILKNAAQAMAGKAYEQEKPTITLRTFQAGGMICLAIEDNGPGMEEVVRKRVFEPFFTTKEPGQGTGLGLSVSYFIVTNNHGGTISVESEPGRGARFTVQLPAAKG